MEWFEKTVYLFFALVHPLTELGGKTSLRTFLNRAYYKTGQEEFPVNRKDGVAGSLFVLALFVAPLLLAVLPVAALPFKLVGLWYFVLGLVLADVIQHATHFASRPGEPGPRVHLLTVLGVLVALLWMHPVDLNRATVGSNWYWLLIGAAVIFGKWFYNSWRVQRLDATGRPVTP